MDLRIWMRSNCTPKSLKYFRDKPDGDPCRMPLALTLQRKNRKPRRVKLHRKSNMPKGKELTQANISVTPAGRQAPGTTQPSQAIISVCQSHKRMATDKVRSMRFDVRSTTTIATNAERLATTTLLMADTIEGPSIIRLQPSISGKDNEITVKASTAVHDEKSE